MRKKKKTPKEKTKMKNEEITTQNWKLKLSV